MTFSFVLAAALATYTAQPPHSHSAWRYERHVLTVPKLPVAQQCVILDADVFSHAAPGLRDLRLVQDGREIPYALDESHDEAFDRAASAKAHAALPSNRAQYETSLVIPALPAYHAGVAGQANSEQLPGWFYGNGELPAHVPVERLRIVPEVTGVESIEMDAWQYGKPKERETLEVMLTPQTPAVNFTVGANLQTTADISVGVHGAMPVVQAFVLEMRRRELCFQPLSRAPLVLFLGNSKARPVRYDYAAHFQPDAVPLLSTLGPTDVNPDFNMQSPVRDRFNVNRFLAALYAGCALLIVASLLRGWRSKP